MIRFVDLTPYYWTLGGLPVCAFLFTGSDCFVQAAGDAFVFGSAEDVDAISDPDIRRRCAALVPDDFWGADEVTALRRAIERAQAELAELEASVADVVVRA